MAIELRRRKLPYDPEGARRHLRRADPVMRRIIAGVGPLELQLRGTPYQSLLRAILYQQLAGAAASAIELPASPKAEACLPGGAHLSIKAFAVGTMPPVNSPTTPMSRSRLGMLFDAAMGR